MLRKFHLFTVNEFVDQDEVSFNTLFVYFAKVRLADRDKPVTEFKDSAALAFTLNADGCGRNAGPENKD